MPSMDGAILSMDGRIHEWDATQFFFLPHVLCFPARTKRQYPWLDQSDMHAGMRHDIMRESHAERPWPTDLHDHFILSFPAAEYCLLAVAIPLRLV